MSRFSIYSSDGAAIRHSGKPKYQGAYLKVSYLDFGEVSSPVPIDWHIGDYVDYPRTGLRYRLYSIPQPKKQGRRKENGASFVYPSVQLHAATKELEMALFNDMVLDAEKNVHFSTREQTSTFEDVYGIARRIQASVDSFFPGKWTIKVMDLDEAADASLIAILSEPKEFQASSGSCLGALNAIYNTWEGIGWIHTYDAVSGKDVITIGRPNKRDASNTSSLFLYGLGKGFTAIKKSYTNSDEFATRLYVYGSDRNLPNRYYNGLKICNAASVDIANLMLPLSRWGKAVDPVTGETRPDASLCYIEDAAKVAKYGLIPRKVYFNGSDNEAIYPSVKNITVGRLRAAKAALGDASYVPSPSVYADASERLDEVKSAINPSDDGVNVDDSDVVFEETKAVSLPSGAAYVGASDNDRDSRPETYHVPAQLTVIDYAPEQSGIKVAIKPDVRVDFDISSPGADSPRVTQRVILTVQNNDGTTSDVATDTALDPSPAVRTTPSRSVSMKNSYRVASGNILRIRIVLLFDRTYAYKAGMSYSFYAASGSIYFGFMEDVSSTFSMCIKQIGFDLQDCVSTGNGGIATISMKDGMCGGRDFTVKRCTYRPGTDDWELTLKRVMDNSTNMRYPNAGFPIKAGDKFVILDIEMPELYVAVGAETLLEKALALYDDVSSGKAYYEPEIDAKKVESSGIVLKEGMYMQLHDEDIIEGYSDTVLIDSLTIDEGESSIPTYKVTLREKKKSSYMETTATALSNLAHQIQVNMNGGSDVDIIMSRDERPEADDNVYSALRSQMEFLSKTKEDEALKRITFKEGLDAGAYAEGMSGARIGPDGSGEFEKVTIRGALQAAEIRFNRVTYSAGDKVLSAGGGKILSATPDVDADGNLLDTGTIKLKLEEGEYGAVAVDDICFGIFHDLADASNNSDADYDDGRGNLRYAGFYTVYFRITEITEKARNSEFKYSLRPASERWTAKHHPAALMNFAVYGNFTNADRQDSYFAGRGYQRYLKGVNDWELTLANIVQQAGRLSNLTVFGKALEGYGEYLNNIYMTGALQSADGSVALDAMRRTMRLGDGLSYDPSNGLKIKGSVIVDGAGEPVTLPSYKGAWGAAVSYSKGDTVTYQGATYIYSYALPTSGHAPTEAGYWSVYAKAGEDGVGGSTTHFAYATSADGSQGFSTTAFDGATYIGSYTDQKIADSTNYKDYTWMRWQGAKGDKGDTGAKGDKGESFYHIEVTADGSTSLRSADDTLTLTARIFYGSTDVTDKFADADVFWTRKSEAGESASWDGRTHTGKTLTIGYSDIAGADFFYANVGVETSGDALTSLGSVLIKIGDELLKV